MTTETDGHYYGKGNSGPARPTWTVGTRVSFAIKGRDYRRLGRVGRPSRDPTGSETALHVWVDWDDGMSGYIDPNSLDPAR